MRILEENVTRRDVITFYINYDCRKKCIPVIENLDAWTWDDPNAINEQLRNNHLKPGVLSAYSAWQLVQLDYADIRQCAIVNHIFPGQPQTLGQIDQALIEKSRPNNNPEWWKPLYSGFDIPQEWALILRPTVRSENPARWYVEDGSGRALALFQRILKHHEHWHTASAYIGTIPDENSCFIQERPELSMH